MFENILIGADPELFVVNPNSGQFISGHGLINGSKCRPNPVTHGAVQVDGTALEFNIDPAPTEDQFVQYIGEVRNQLQQMVSGYRLVAEPVADFDPTYFKSIPLVSKALGCDPDYDAWELQANNPPEGERPFRTGAGHIHIGWTNGADPFDPEHFMLCAEVSKQLDYYLGIHSLSWDPDNRRRELYGRAGAFRPKPYGVEYRVLSNRWLASELLQRWVYRATIRAMRDLDEGNRLEDKYGDTARSIINENRVSWKIESNIRIPGLPNPPAIREAA